MEVKVRRGMVASISEIKKMRDIASDDSDLSSIDSIAEDVELDLATIQLSYGLDQEANSLGKSKQPGVDELQRRIIPQNSTTSLSSMSQTSKLVDDALRDAVGDHLDAMSRQPVLHKITPLTFRRGRNTSSRSQAREGDRSQSSSSNPTES